MSDFPWSETKNDPAHERDVVLPIDERGIESRRTGEIVADLGPQADERRDLIIHAATELHDVRAVGQPAILRAISRPSRPQCEER